MSISIYGALLPTPDSKEAFTFYGETTQPLNRAVKNCAAVQQKNLKIAHLVLNLGLEALDAYIEKKYKAFNALIKNFACEVTALEVLELSQDASLLEEAIQTKKCIEETLQRVLEYKRDIKPLPLGEPGMTCKTYFQERLKIDVSLSEKLAHVVALYILQKVNSNEPSRKNPERETPVTKYSQLPNLHPTNLVPAIITSLQSKLSLKAALYVKSKLEILSETKKDIKNLYQETLITYKNTSPITKLSLTCNLQTVFHSYKGTLLVRTKILLCGKKIQDAVDEKIFLKLPEEEVLSIESIDKERAFMVIEGYLQKGGSLEEVVKEGIFPLIEKSISYEEHKEQAPPSFEIDHIYASSLKEEL